MFCGLLLSIAAVAKDGRNLAVKESSSAGKRIALVIGNGNYQADNLPKLANPTHDAEDIAKVLRGFGFEVIQKKDLSKEEMDTAITDFGRKISDSDAALFYFAGHGLQLKGRNYLMPVNAKIESEARVPYESIDVNLILDEMDNGKSRANIVMLDACRNNPISGKFRTGTTRGLAAISSPPQGTVIVYATDPGNVAADGAGRNGLFTAGLLTAFKGNDLSLHGVLVRTSKEVEVASDKKQTPYINGPAILQEEFHFDQGTQQASLESIPVPSTIKKEIEIEQESWESVRDSGNIEAIQEYVKQYPKGRFVGQARILITTLKKVPQKNVESAATHDGLPLSMDNETALWTEAQKGNSREDYQAYLGQYPKGKYVALAKARLKKFEDEVAKQAKQEREAIALQVSQAKAEALKQEQDAWESASGIASLESYQGYLNDYPNGRFATLAQGRVAKLQKEASQQAEQQSAWSKANGIASIASYQSYINDYPNGQYARLAQERIVKLQESQQAALQAAARQKQLEEEAAQAARREQAARLEQAERQRQQAAIAAISPVMLRIPGKNYELGKYHVTRGEFAKFVSDTRYDAGISCWVWIGKWEQQSGRSWRDPGFAQEDNHPVACVNWNDAQAYVDWLSKKTGRQYRLPVEEEWEYACQGGSKTEYCGGDNLDAVGWYWDNSGKHTHPVGQKQANGYGLYDMTGNVLQ